MAKASPVWKDDGKSPHNLMQTPVYAKLVGRLRAARRHSTELELFCNNRSYCLQSAWAQSTPTDAVKHNDGLFLDRFRTLKTSSFEIASWKEIRALRKGAARRRNP
jgi:hypothetical protein